ILLLEIKSSSSGKDAVIGEQLEQLRREIKCKQHLVRKAVRNRPALVCVLKVNPHVDIGIQIVQIQTPPRCEKNWHGGPQHRDQRRADVVGRTNNLIQPREPSAKVHAIVPLKQFAEGLSNV